MLSAQVFSTCSWLDLHWHKYIENYLPHSQDYTLLFIPRWMSRSEKEHRTLFNIFWCLKLVNIVIFAYILQTNELRNMSCTQSNLTMSSGIFAYRWDLSGSKRLQTQAWLYEYSRSLSCFNSMEKVKPAPYIDYIFSFSLDQACLLPLRNKCIHTNMCTRQ